MYYLGTRSGQVFLDICGYVYVLPLKEFLTTGTGKCWTKLIVTAKFCKYSCENEHLQTSVQFIIRSFTLEEEDISIEACELLSVLYQVVLFPDFVGSEIKLLRLRF